MDMIFDIDGVVLDTDTLHLRSWRDACYELGFSDYTAELYAQYNKGTPRVEGARTLVDAIGGIIDASELAQRKDDIYRAMIDDGQVLPYEDTMRVILSAYEIGRPPCFGSSSTNALRNLERVRPFEHLDAMARNRYSWLTPKFTLLDAFSGGIYGKQAFPGKPAPDIFLAVAAAHGLDPRKTTVFEDAVAGVQAAKAGGFYCVGLSRDGNVHDLRAAGADVVYTVIPFLERVAA